MTDVDNELIATDDYIKKIKNNPIAYTLNYNTRQKEIKLKDDLKNTKIWKKNSI